MVQVLFSTFVFKSSEAAAQWDTWHRNQPILDLKVKLDVAYLSVAVTAPEKQWLNISLLKNNQNTYHPRFGTQNRYNIPKTRVLFLLWG